MVMNCASGHMVLRSLWCWSGGSGECGFLCLDPESHHAIGGTKLEDLGSWSNSCLVRPSEIAVELCCLG